MSDEIDPDPGGSEQNESYSSQQLSDLKDENQQQLLLINQLKEMLRKEQSSVSQEKVEEYVNTLNKVKAKRSKQKKEQSSSSSQFERSSSSVANIDVTKKERLNLLRQKLEENKLKLAERGKSQKGIKEMVTQFQAQFNDSEIAASPALNLVDSKNLSYNENTSQKELYNILLTKEKAITELLSKSQNYESTIIDLQENLKEKDSVIDARTKAITLMTDSLSRKGKSTLDDLEERKEQMRKMQENFITLEAEMKARQLTLLNDLKLKNFEISDLQQLNDELKKEKLELQQKINIASSQEESKVDVEKLLKENSELKEENNNYLLKVTNFERELADSKKSQSEATEKENGEVSKLKKQLEESNKNMIKMKATHKNQIKQLNKQLNQFKKMNNSNSLIAQLQSEISQLTEKITALEEEKANTQLESKPDVKHEEHDDKTEAQTEQLAEKDKIIEILEAEVLTLKTALKQSSEEQAKIDQQVSNEMKLIQYEEQIDKIELEKKQLKIENDELLEKNEILQKEKQDLSTKLDNYIQENMELIDKLEKLSAEKVSSVESIEIVEGLTQQEKLELAAYQKNLSPEDTLKSHDHSPEPLTDLNETVLQLNEDTAELLQKIEMYTMERNDVMQQMEAIRNENNSLTLKIKDLENSKNILEETYEQLYNEKEKLLEENRQLLENLEQINSKKIEESAADASDSKLQMEYDELLKEHDKLKGTLTNFELANEEIKRKLHEALEENNNLNAKLQNNLEEIKTYQETIEINKTELIESSSLINDLNNKLREREKSLEDFNVNVQDLYVLIENLQLKASNYEKIEADLKEYEKGIAFHSETIHKLNDELISSNSRLTQYENDLKLKDEEINKLTNNILKNEGIIRNLEQSIEEKDVMFRQLNEEMKIKYIELQQQIDTNEGSLQTQVNDLSNKNKEQLEKMKKIAANLKKKTQAYQDLQQEYSNDKIKWENESKEKDSSIETFEERITSLTKKLKDTENQLKVKLEENQFLQNEVKCLKQDTSDLETEIIYQQNDMLELKQEKLSEVSLQQELSDSLHETEIVEENFSKNLSEKLKDIENQLKVKQEENEFLQNEVNRLKQDRSALETGIIYQQSDRLELKQEKLSEVSLQQEMSDSLHETEIVEENFSKNLSEQKIRELELLLETNESELNYQKHRLERYEENARRIEEEKTVLEKKNVELENNFSLLSNELKEKKSIEEQLKVQFDEIKTNNEILSKQLQEIQRERQELLVKSQENDELIKRLKLKLKKSHEKVSELRQSQDHVQEIEHMNEVLKTRIASLEANQQHIQHENESLQKRNMSDYEKIEADYQLQLEELLKVQSEIQVDKEKLLEKVKNLESDEQELRIELEEYKLKFDENENQHEQHINQLNDELRQFEETIKSKELDIQKLIDDLNKSSMEVQDHLNKIEVLKKSISDMEELKIQLESVQSEKEQLHLSLLNSNDKLEQCMSEKANLQREYNNSLEHLESSKQEIQNLQHKIIVLEDEIQALEFAKLSLEASYDSSQKLTKAEAPSEVKVLENFQKRQVKSDQEAIPTFQWNEMNQQQNNSQTDFFDSFSAGAVAAVPKETFDSNRALFNVEDGAHAAAAIPIPITKDEQQLLFQEFQTLQYLVHNLQQEKDNLIERVNVLSDELSDLAIKELDAQEKEIEWESQIMQQDEIDNLAGDKRALEKTEYADSNVAVGGDPAAEVQEDIITPKKAYLCFEDDKNEHLKNSEEPSTSIDAQILSEKQVSELASNKKALEKLEFQLVDQIEPQQQKQQPVVEPSVHPKHAYLCYTNDEKRKSIDAFEENDDGWAWGPEEAKLEAEHLSNLENIPQVKHLLLEINQLKENIQVLQVERENHLEEIRQLQVKSGKLVKKCKELKSKCDNKVSDDFGLNETIQEELKIQIAQLEKQVADISSNHEKEKSQKEQLAKKVQTLTVTNEQMAEMKEIADSEVLRLQRKYDESMEKLKKYEWGADGFGNDELITHEEKASETQPIIKVESPDLNLQVERAPDLSNELFQQKEIVAEKDKVINQLQETIKELKEDLEAVETNYTTIEDHLKKELNNLSLELISKDSSITELNGLVENLKTEKETLEESQKESSDKLTATEAELSNKIKELEENKEIIVDLQQKINNIELTTAMDHKSKEENNQLIQTMEIKSQEIEESKKLIEKLQLESELLRKTIEEKTEQIDQLNNTLNAKQLDFETLTNQLDKQAKEFEEKLIELNESCESRVDQRGSEVAESWKLYLENVEKEFETVQVDLKKNISELEEKYNQLRNENNELRKNVDQERNIEVNRIFELQQQIKNNEQQINALNLIIQEKEQLLENAQRDIVQNSILKQQFDSLKMENEEKEAKLNNINIVIEATQKQFDEKREVIEEIVAILERNTTAPISYEKQDVLNEFQRQLNLNNDKINENAKLMQQIQELETNLKRIDGEKNREILGLNQVIEDLQKESSVLHEKDAEIVRLSNELNKVHKEKEGITLEINHKNEETAKLQQEIEKLKELHVKCQSAMADYQELINRLNLAQETLNIQNETIKELRQNIEDIRELKVNESNTELVALNQELTELKQDHKMLQMSFSDTEMRLHGALAEVERKSQELSTVNQFLVSCQQITSESNEKIQLLSEHITALNEEQSKNLQFEAKKVDEIHKDYKQLMSNKDNQIAELDRISKEYNAQLEQEKQLKQQLEQQLNDKMELVNEDTKQLEELKLIIEEQVARIEELKKALFDKSNQYDSLIAEMDVGRLPVTHQPSKHDKNETEILDPVNRAELDVALYMLHQRDVRCEELTVELTQLLEERDTLQLKLSNAIREKEDLKRKISGETSNISNDKLSTVPNTLSEVTASSSSVELSKNSSSENEQALATKLSELKSVGYKKDKTFVDEQEARRIQQYAIMQEHINDASKLPPEAVAKLLDASYTLSRDVQSPSKVLLNWLWGKSPPKANDS